MGSKRQRHKDKNARSRPGPHAGGPGRALTRQHNGPKVFSQKILRRKFDPERQEMTLVPDVVKWKATQVPALVRAGRTQRRFKAQRQARKENRA